MVQRAKFCTQTWFFTFIVNYEKYVPEEFLLCSHLYIVRACLAVPLCLNGCYIMVLEFGCCVWVRWKQPCSFQKQLWERICTVLSHTVRENGLSFKETSLKVWKLGMTLGIYFNLSWALLSSSVKRWTWNRRNLRSLPTLNILRLY